MSRETSKPSKRIDAELKAMFDAKASEPVPDHIIDLVEDLETPPKATKAG